MIKTKKIKLNKKQNKINIFKYKLKIIHTYLKLLKKKYNNGYFNFSKIYFLISYFSLIHFFYYFLILFILFLYIYYFLYFFIIIFFIIFYVCIHLKNI